MEMNLGKKIKELRLKKKLTLKQISEKTDLSISFLSQVERSQSSITLTSLKKISEALGANPAYFFPAEQEQKANITRGGNLKEIRFNDSIFTYTDLSGDFPDPIFQPILATLLPGERNKVPYSHKGQEFVYVLEGLLTVLLNNEEYLLYPGDSLHIDSMSPHTWFNDTDKTVKLIIVSATN